MLWIYSLYCSTSKLIHFFNENNSSHCRLQPSLCAVTIGLVLFVFKHLEGYLSDCLHPGLSLPSGGNQVLWINWLRVEYSPWSYLVSWQAQKGKIPDISISYRHRVTFRSPLFPGAVWWQLASLELKLRFILGAWSVLLEGTCKQRYWNMLNLNVSILLGKCSKQKCSSHLLVFKNFVTLGLSRLRHPLPNKILITVLYESKSGVWGFFLFLCWMA